MTNDTRNPYKVPHDRAFKREFKKKCYNFSEIRHLSSACTKPKKQCTNCKLLGHVASECRRTTTSVNTTTVKRGQEFQDGKKTDCYYVICQINGRPFCGYIDTSCTGVIIRENVVKQLGFQMEKCCYAIDGYAGKTVFIGKTLINLRVDSAQDDVDVLVVKDEVHTVPILIGQSFINTDKIQIVKNNQTRPFNDDVVKDINLEVLFPKKIALHAEDTVMIPPYQVKYVKVSSKDKLSGTVFVEGHIRSAPSQEHIVTQCVTSLPEGVVSVL